MTRASEATGTENLLIGIDLSLAPTLDMVVQQSAVLYELYAECYVLDLTMREHANPRRYVEPASRFVPPLFVKRMSLASPWEIVLTQAISGTPYATAAAATYGGLRALRYLLELKRDWDTHRLYMEREKADLDKLRLDYATETTEAVQRMLAAEYGLDSRIINRGPGMEENIRDLRPLTLVESISDDDPRA